MSFVNGMDMMTSVKSTENGAIAYNTSGGGALLDFFAVVGGMRKRDEADIVQMYHAARKEDKELADKIVLYARDVRGAGLGERRIGKILLKALAHIDHAKVERNFQTFVMNGRFDDLYALEGTPAETAMWQFMKDTLLKDAAAMKAGKPISLAAKWMKSINTSSAESKRLARKFCTVAGISERTYRKTLAALRKYSNVVEVKMSANEWEAINFEAVPSIAMKRYSTAFGKHCPNAFTRYKHELTTGEAKVNAKTLYPYECVERAREAMGCVYSWYGYKTPAINTVDRLMVNKYWENLADYINGAAFNGIAIVDTSGSMCGSGYGNRTVAPIDVAISIGMYCAEKNRGPYAGHFLTFNSQPKFMKVEGIDFCDKVSRIFQAPWGGSTNIEAAFDLILQIAIDNHCSSDEIPQNLIVISDMEFNSCATSNGYGRLSANSSLFEQMRAKWETYGYKMPKLVFWNVDARQDNFAMKDEENVSYVSGFSPVLFEQIMKGKTAQDLMYDKLNDKRYACIK